MGADDSVVVLRSNDGRTFAIPLKRALKSQYLIDAYTEFKKGMASFDTDGGVIIDVGLANGTILEYIANLLQKNTPRVPQGVAYDMAFDFLYLFGLDCKLLKRALLHFPGQSMAYAYLTDSENKLIYRRDWLQYELPAWEWGIMASVVQLIRAYPNSAKHEFMKRQFQRVPGYNAFLQIESDSLSDPANDCNWTIQLVAKNGHAEVVRMLLDTPNCGIDPAAGRNYAIRAAAVNGYAEVVRMLLDTPNRGIHPAADDNYAIRFAAGNGRMEVVRLLLDTPNRGIDPATQDNYAIRAAVRNDNTEVVRMLLADPRVRNTLSPAQIAEYNI